jgi:uncharacterized sulfatase
MAALRVPRSLALNEQEMKQDRLLIKPWKTGCMVQFTYWTFFAICLGLAPGFASAAERPNILWLVAEDINPHLGCFGDTNANTPNLDRLAAKGLRFPNCWSTAPVCAPARTALITGMSPASLGAEHMRSLVNTPTEVRLFPQILRENGYYCSNNSKEDYNVPRGPKVWDESSKKAHYRNRAPGQPFLAVFNMEITHESQIRKRPHTLRHDPARINLPPYHPDTPEVRHDWAQYYDNISTMDGQAAEYLKDLEAEGFADNTIVFFYGDNGSGMPRHKRWPFNSGLSVPLIIHVPKKWASLAPQGYEAGAASRQLVAFVDFAPTVLSMAGIKPPAWMQGRAFMGSYPAAPRQHIFGLRGRMDERYDLVRSVRDERYIYVRNYLPHLVYGQFLAYMFETPTTRIWKQLYDTGKLRPPQTAFWEPKPPEELYDLQADPYEINNLASSKAHEPIRKALKKALDQHLVESRDLGFLPEGERSRVAGNEAPAKWAASNSNYPVQEVLEIADAASSLQPEALRKLDAGLRSPNTAVRYWSAMGFLMRGSNTVASALAEMRPLLQDNSPSVRIAAAEALGRFGNQDDLSTALAALKPLLDLRNHGTFTALAALNALEALGAKGALLQPWLAEIPRRDPNGPQRTAEYVDRFLKAYQGESNTNAISK